MVQTKSVNGKTLLQVVQEETGENAAEEPVRDLPLSAGIEESGEESGREERLKRGGEEPALVEESGDEEGVETGGDEAGSGPGEKNAGAVDEETGEKAEEVLQEAQRDGVESPEAVEDRQEIGIKGVPPVVGEARETAPGEVACPFRIVAGIEHGVAEEGAGEELGEVGEAAGRGDDEYRDEDFFCGAHVSPSDGRLYPKPRPHPAISVRLV